MRYERESILSDSPASLIQDYLEDDGEILGGLGGIDGNTDENRSIVSDLGEKLKKPHTVRLFGARSAAACVQVSDHQDWRTAIWENFYRRYLTREQILGLVLARGERILRVFDEGNQPSVSAIVDLKGAVRDRLASAGRIIIPEGTSAGAIEQCSTDAPMLQAAHL